MNLYQHTKNQAISSILYWDALGLKILKSRTRFFIDGIRQIISTPIKDQMHWNLMTKVFNNLKKPYLGLFWANFGINKFENLALSLSTSCCLLIPFQNLEKNIWSDSMKNIWIDRWEDKWTELIL